MELKELFKMQKKLDEHIIKEKGLEGQDLLPKKILALQVELGELANELPEVFKFWSNKKNDYEKALKEYVDCLHFILSIGLDLEMDKSKVEIDSDYTEEDIVQTFNICFDYVATLNNDINYGSNCDIRTSYVALINLFIGLGEKYLDFNIEQIEKAYLDKNKVNHQRQENGY